MNVRSYTLDFTLESQHVKEVISSLFHTILLHRTFGKISYKKESTYSIGTFEWLLTFRNSSRDAKFNILVLVRPFLHMCTFARGFRSTFLCCVSSGNTRVRNLITAEITIDTKSLLVCQKWNNVCNYIIYIRGYQICSMRIVLGITQARRHQEASVSRIRSIY